MEEGCEGDDGGVVAGSRVEALLDVEDVQRVAHDALDVSEVVRRVEVRLRHVLFGVVCCGFDEGEVFGARFGAEGRRRGVCDAGGFLEGARDRAEI